MQMNMQIVKELQREQGSLQSPLHLSLKYVHRSISDQFCPVCENGVLGIRHNYDSQAPFNIDSSIVVNSFTLFHIINIIPRPVWSCLKPSWIQRSPISVSNELTKAAFQPPPIPQSLSLSLPLLLLLLLLIILSTLPTALLISLAAFKAWMFVLKASSFRFISAQPKNSTFRIVINEIKSKLLHLLRFVLLPRYQFTDFHLLIWNWNDRES